MKIKVGCRRQHKSWKWLKYKLEIQTLKLEINAEKDNFKVEKKMLAI